ncbi:MAG: hypothetical protein HN687_12705 [Candidatus Marinimicrobia bacterium]|mgnify:FL=1|jgi:hypothetical protein|nr:hypothetical protein [Candidatus Neomarinimicrobiota bacterium]
MLPWESKELNTLKTMRRQLTSIWNHTELEMDDCSKMDVISEMEEVSAVINKILILLDDELDRLIVRDSQVIERVCSHCESNKITICQPCLEEMSHAKN